MRCPGADGVNQAGGNVKMFPLFQMGGAYQLLHLARFRRPADVRERSGFFHSSVNQGIRVCMQHVPYLVFNLSPPCCRRAFRGMHLDGKILTGVQNFAEQGKTRKTFVAGPEEFFPLFFPQPVQGHSFPFAFPYRAHGFRTVADFPGFPVGRFPVGQFPAQHGSHVLAAPDARLIDGMESKRLHRNNGSVGHLLRPDK